MLPLLPRPWLLCLAGLARGSLPGVVLRGLERLLLANPPPPTRLDDLLRPPPFIFWRRILLEEAAAAEVAVSPTLSDTYPSLACTPVGSRPPPPPPLPLPLPSKLTLFIIIASSGKSGDG